MGRFYSGDIQGKFWFGVQDSDDASFFGGERYEPNHIEYLFSKDDLPEIKKGIAECLHELGDNKKKLDDFFKEYVAYNDKSLVKETGILKNRVGECLVWYARLILGEKILKQVEKSGSCEFEAEL